MAEAFGRSLLSEVEEVGLNEILQTIRARQEQRHVQLSHEENNPTLADQLLQLDKKDASPNITELIAPQPDSGASSLLYYIIATTLSNPTNAIVLIDCDSTFSITHLAQHLTAILDKGFDSNATESLTTSVQTHLRHLHILRPQSMASLLSTLEALPSYLLDTPIRHYSFDCTPALIAVHNLTSLTAEDNAPPSSIAALSTALHSLAQTLSFPPILVSTWNPTSTSLPPPPLAGMKARRLVVRREVVRKFPAGMSVEEARREKGDRWAVVSRGRFEISELGGRGWREVFRLVRGLVVPVTGQSDE